MPERMSDVIVLLPGILGSELEKHGRKVWGWSGRVLARNLFGFDTAAVDDLWVAQDSPDAETLDDGVVATRLLPDLHLVPGLWKIDGYGAVSSFLFREFEVERDRNYFEFAYDWRRDNRASAHTLKRRTDDWLHRWRRDSGNADAKLILVAHSMGGLVSRYFLEVLEGWRDTRALITFGTPYRGSLNAVEAIANGLVKLGIVDLTPLARRLASLHQLLPIYECLDAGDGRLQRVGDGALPHADAARLADARAFHDEIRTAVETHAQDDAYRRGRYRLYPIVGYRQPTAQAARVEGDRVVLLQEIHGQDWSGDGTVPRPSAMPLEQEDASLGMFAATRHASLQNADAVLAHLSGLITGLSLPLGVFRAARKAPVQVSLAVDDLYRAGQPVVIRVRPSRREDSIGVTIVDVERGHEVARAPLVRDGDEWLRTSVPSLPPGAYRVTVSGSDAVEPAADAFEVL